MNQLEKGSDTSTTTNQANLSVLVSSVRVLGDRTLERNGIIGIKTENVVAKLSGLILLDDKLEAARGLKIRDRSIRSNHIRALGSDVLGQKARSVSETQDIISRKLEGEFLGLQKKLADNQLKL